MNERQVEPLGGADEQTSAAAVICYIRDLIMASSLELNKIDFLVLLERVSHDPELFPIGIGAEMWAVETDG